MKHFWFLLVFAVLCGCATANRKTVFVVGNSITLHAPAPSIGWFGDWGMAAPTEDIDFSHIVAATLNAQLSVNNLGIEGGSQEARLQIPVLAKRINSSTIIVLELGDNAPFAGDVEGFASAYDQLVEATSHGKALVCVSTFWHYTDIDAIIKAACEANHGRYAYIGDILNDPANPDRQSTAYWSWEVNDHPQKWGHRMIAERVLAQLP